MIAVVPLSLLFHCDSLLHHLPPGALSKGAEVSNSNTQMGPKFEPWTESQVNVIFTEKNVPPDRAVIKLCLVPY